MNILIISRYSRTHVRRGGGIVRTAQLTRNILTKLGCHVDIISDMHDEFNISSYDLVWIYTADLSHVSEHILNKITPKRSNIPIIINSAWVPNSYYEKSLVETIHKHRINHNNLGLSVWTNKAANIITQKAEMDGIKVVHFPHIQNINLTKPPLNWNERSGIVVGELGKLMRNNLSSFGVPDFLKKIHKIGLGDELYAYGQYKEEIKDTPFDGLVKIIPKASQDEFFNRLSTFRINLLFSDKETFAATPIELSSYGVIPLVPYMPQSLDEYISPKIPRLLGKEIDIELIRDHYYNEELWKEKSNEAVLYTQSMNQEALGRIFINQISLIINEQ